MSSCTDERNAQILIQVLKAHGIKKVIASPGTTNACLVSSMQSDPFFEIYSAPEERSGAYMACGMAAESGEPVVLSCTGATASRNYMPALTEAFYRKLPILTVTSSRRNAYIGHNCDQVTDRTVLPNDVAKISVQMPIVLDDVSEWNCIINANKAVLELYHRGGGPAHINLETTYSKKKVADIQPVRIIRRFMKYDEFPNITAQRVCIFVGAHVEMDDKLERAISEFCKKYNGIVLCDHTSNYRGEYRAFCSIVADQYYWKSTIQNVKLMVHIGDISSSDYKIQAKEVWRVNPDGEIRDTFQKLYNVFEMKEVEFFEYYNKKKQDYSNSELLIAYHQEEKEILSRMPEFPFSNIWIASVTAKKLPSNSVLHLGIRNSLRSWNYFDTQETVTGYSNTGGFGIDGSLSTVIGAALCHPDRLYYCVLGDLAFFYDMNALGNRHVPSNIRILVVNNGLGFEMKFPASWGYSIANSIGVSEDNYVCAAGHYSSPDLIKSYVYGLGFEYLKVSTKEQYLDCLPKIVSNEKQDRTLVVEIVVNSENEDAALNLIGSIMVDESNVAKAAIKKAIGKKGIDAIKKMMGR
ncbi:thiamine pyrophosphate-binding protein [Faecalibacterium sp. HTF-76H]|uniref:Thiamine pyrophosphate-binding protein n=1 Tax=Faecalibacterium taiwanense TaxID=3030638 RepID=A0AB35XZJ2_9FIRM